MGHFPVVSGSQKGDTAQNNRDFMMLEADLSFQMEVSTKMRGTPKSSMLNLAFPLQIDVKYG